jgi:hypothetical protein
LQTESTLQYHDFKGVLTSFISEPKQLQSDATNQQKEFEASLKVYKKANGFAVTLLTMEDEPLQLVIMFKTAKDIWDKLLTKVTIQAGASLFTAARL